MERNIVIFSHNTHNFLKNEIRFASKNFIKVVLICPFNEELKHHTSEFSNVEVYFYSKKEYYFNALSSLYKIFEKEKRSEIINSVKVGKFTIEYIKHYMQFLALERILNRTLINKLNLSTENTSSWILYSAWYYGTAYSIVKFKEKYPKVKTISLAHSFEVDEEKNPFTQILFRKLYHQGLDGISFISYNVFDMFKNKIALPNELNLKNVKVNYLGTNRLYSNNSSFSEDGIIRIVSCSHVVPIKRIELIFESLDKYKGSKIEWTHIGDGHHMNYIKKLIKNKQNSNFKIKLLGAMENKKIHEYYSNNPVDIFINTSKSEGIPVTIMEAIAYGIPAIATDVGGNNEIVNDNLGRLVSESPTTIEINKAIKSIISLSISEKEIMRNNAIRYFNENFNSDIIREQFFIDLRNV